MIERVYICLNVCSSFFIYSKLIQVFTVVVRFNNQELLLFKTTAETKCCFRTVFLNCLTILSYSVLGFFGLPDWVVRGLYRKYKSQ